MRKYPEGVKEKLLKQKRLNQGISKIFTFKEVTTKCGTKVMFGYVMMHWVYEVQYHDGYEWVKEYLLPEMCLTLGNGNYMEKK